MNRSNKNHVFVYGTLKSSWRDRYGLDESQIKSLGNCAITGSIMLTDLGAFPGLYRSRKNLPKGNTVFGELLEVSDDILATMDLIEGHPSFYKRERVVVHPKNSSLDQSTQCYTYILPWPDHKARFSKQSAESLSCWRPSKEETVFMNGKVQ